MRKSKIYLLLSVLCFVVLVVICFIFRLPNAIWFNFFRIFLVLAAIILFRFSIFQKDYEFVVTSDKNIDDLRKEYDYIHTIVLVHTRLIYDNLSPDFIKKYLVSIDKYDGYLLDFEANIESFKAKSSKNEITNEYISIACVMDALISGWKITTSISEKVALIDDLIWLNCKLSVCVALSLMNLSYDDLKDSVYIKRLIELLYICCFDKDYGKTSIIENEAMILELLYDKFTEK